MGLVSGCERLLDAQVELQCAGAEPGAAARPQLGRLVHLDQAEDPGVEGPGLVLAAAGQGELDVVQRGHGSS